MTMPSPQTIRRDPSHLADAADDANILLAHAEDALAFLARVVEDGDPQAQGRVFNRVHKRYDL